MLKTLTKAVAVTALATSMTATSFDTAEARKGRRAAVIGGIALGALALGALSAHGGYYGRACYRGPKECHWVGGGCYYNRYGDYICRRGHRECYRPTYCD
jgi:hypothetical protein